VVEKGCLSDSWLTQDDEAPALAGVDVRQQLRQPRLFAPST
jgi:hypothetical protein